MNFKVKHKQQFIDRLVKVSVFSAIDYSGYKTLEDQAPLFTNRSIKKT